MKIGLFKKSLACVLSVSFLLTLASCSLGSSSSDNGKGENIFKNKDIQAYAKRNAYTPTDYSEVELKEIDTKNEIIAERAFSYTLFKGVTDSNKYRLSIRYTNVSVNITVDSGEAITKVTPADDWNNSFGYFIVNYSTGKKAVYDYKGIEVVTKREATEISVNHVTSNNQTVNTRRIFI